METHMKEVLTSPTATPTARLILFALASLTKCDLMTYNELAAATGTSVGTLMNMLPKFLSNGTVRRTKHMRVSFFSVHPYLTVKTGVELGEAITKELTNPEAARKAAREWAERERAEKDAILARQLADPTNSVARIFFDDEVQK
jgi:hypothetical protein